ncbi:hypothetical protein AAEX28_14600 [Lentisphaerota bacterium WC36G]|nr:hypothetical protein LJT99_01355 [Lentisphaerae bacterium WC36]
MNKMMLFASFFCVSSLYAVDVDVTHKKSFSLGGEEFSRNLNLGDWNPLNEKL